MQTYSDNLQFNPSLEKSTPTSQWQQAGGQSNWSIPSAPAWNGWNNSSRGWNSRRINLRTRNWGSRSENGWSGFNSSLYSQQGLSNWEWKSVILQELRSQYGGRSRGVTFAPSTFASSPSTFVSAPSTFVSAAPSTFAAAPATIVPVNMLPAPINDGRKYEKLIGSAPRSRKYRKHLKQPLSNNASMTPLSAGLLNQGYALPASSIPASNQKLSRKQRKAIKKQNKTGVLPSNSLLTPLGTSATSGLRGLPTHAAPLNNGFAAAPLNNGFAAAPLNNGLAAAPLLNNGFGPQAGQKLSRKQKKQLRKQNAALKKSSSSSNAFLAPNVLPAGQPVVNAIPVTNVLASPVLSAAAPLAPASSSFLKQELPLVSPVAMGRSAF